MDSIYENLYEYYVNDYIIFEGILRRDYYEVTGILNEDGNKNFLQKLYDKILSLCGKIKEKITSLFNSGIKILSNNLNQAITDDMNSYKNCFRDENGELDEFTTNIKLFNPIDYDKFFDNETNIMKKLNNIGEYLIAEEFKSLQDKVNNIKEYSKQIHNKIWINKEIKYPFKEMNGLKKYIENEITESRKNKILGNINARKTIIINSINGIEKKTKRDIEKYKDNLKGFPHYNTEVEISQNNLIKMYTNILKSLPLYEQLCIAETRIFISEYNKIYKTCVKLYISAGEYLLRKMS